jgi:hypothetical protein
VIAYDATINHTYRRHANRVTSVNTPSKSKKIKKKESKGTDTEAMDIEVGEKEYVVS